MSDRAGLGSGGAVEAGSVDVSDRACRTSADSLVVACDKYLESKRIQLWAHFSISRPEDRWDAAVWLAEQVRGVGFEQPRKRYPMTSRD